MSLQSSSVIKIVAASSLFENMSCSDGAVVAAVPMLCVGNFLLSKLRAIAASRLFYCYKSTTTVVYLGAFEFLVDAMAQLDSSLGVRAILPLEILVDKLVFWRLRLSEILRFDFLYTILRLGCCWVFVFVPFTELLHATLGIEESPLTYERQELLNFLF